MLLHALHPSRWSTELIGRFTEINGSPVAQSRAQANILVWSSKAFKIMISFENASRSIAMIWITHCWQGNSAHSLAGSSPWRGRPCAGGRDRGDCKHSCHCVAPWYLGQKHSWVFCLTPICLTSSNCANRNQQRRLKPLTAVSLICW